jgi:predicted TIM-barrel fold metal-dependent hydrolase
MSADSQIIDVWMQHPTMKFGNHRMFDSLRRWTGQEKLTSELPLELTISMMDQANVSKSLICAWWSPSGPLISNEEVASYVQKYPNRLVGVASVDLYRPMEAIRELWRCVKEYGFKALRIVQWLWNLPPTDRHYYPLYAECVELGIPFCCQVGHTGPLCPSEPGRPIPYIDEVAIDFPELKIVGGHIGYPWTVEMIAVATKHENVYIDTSAYVAKRFPPELVNYMQKNGKKKVMFGTNYPMVTPAMCLKDLNTLNLTDEVKNLYLYENAQRVFGI